MGCGGVEGTLAGAGDFCRGGVLAEEMFPFGDDMVDFFCPVCVCIRRIWFNLLSIWPSLRSL
jgi:hypothetical protein